MKRFDATIIVTIAAAMLTATPAPARDLVYGTGLPIKHRTITTAIIPYFEAVRRDSNGTLNFKIMPGSQVVNLRSALAGVRDGLVDAGFIIPPFVRKELIHNNIIWDTQFLGSDPIAAAGAAAETILLHCASCRRDYKNYNALYLGGYAGDPQSLMCRTPVKTVADVAGKKIRGAGASNRWAKAMGGVPIGMAPTEMISALERGAIDCVLGPSAWIMSFGLKDITKHVVDFPMGTPRAIAAVVVNRDTWRRFTGNQRRAMVRNMPNLIARGTIDGFIRQAKRNRELAKTHGVTYYKGGQDFADLMARFVKKETTVIPAILKKQGARKTKQILALFRRSLKKWQRISRERIAGDPDAFAAALKTEIYGKLNVNTM